MGKETAQIVGEQSGDSSTQVRRYIRLTELIPEILEMVDEGKIALRPAVEISYLPPDLQEELLDNMEMEACTPNHAQTLRMRVLLKDGKLTPESIAAIMQEEKPNQREQIKLRADALAKYFPEDYTPKQKTDLIERLVKEWYEKQELEKTQSQGNSRGKAR